MESISSQYESSHGMGMWEALVQVASQRYEELLEEERRQKQSITKTNEGKCESEQPSTLIRSAEISIAENVTLNTEDEDEEDTGRLVIDETSVVVTKAEPFVDQVVPVSTEIIEHENPMYQRETVIKPCRSSCADSDISVISDQGDSPRVRATTTSLIAGVKPMRQPKHMSQVTFNRHMPYSIPMSYNKNMARKFPGSECRTPEQQAVREKNTIAARQSRAKMRMMDEMLQQEATNEKTHNHYMKERMAGIFTYAIMLRRKIGLDETDYLEEFERVKHDYVPGPMRTHYVRNRSRSRQEHEEHDQSSQFSINDCIGSHNASDETINVKSNGSETDSAPEPDETVLDLSLRSKRDVIVVNGGF